MTGRSIGFALSIAGLTLVGSLASGDEAKSTKGTVRASDGLNLVYDSRGTGDTALVFLHGWCGNRAWWKDQMNAFAGDFRCIAVDQAGHGESGKDRKEWTVQSLAADVESLVKSLGLKRVILVGHSMGGPIALAAAKRLPGTVVGIVGVDSLQNAEMKPPEEQRKQFLASFEADFKGTMRAGLRGMLPEKVDPAFLESLASGAEQQDRTMAISLLRHFGGLDLPTLFRDAKVPVRCINSGGGFAFFAPTAPDINKKYADFKAVTIDNVGHFPMLEKPAEFNEKLREVLKEFAGKHP
jgi:pimeloyl-ACP methyl ester carboxylesterase